MIWLLETTLPNTHGEQNTLYCRNITHHIWTRSRFQTNRNTNVNVLMLFFFNYLHKYPKPTVFCGLEPCIPKMAKAWRLNFTNLTPISPMASGKAGTRTQLITLQSMKTQLKWELCKLYCEDWVCLVTCTTQCQWNVSNVVCWVKPSSSDIKSWSARCFLGKSPVIIPWSTRRFVYTTAFVYKNSLYV